MKKIPAKSISYAYEKRNKNTISYIVIHNTGNNNDTAENNGKYFANTNTRKAGAHFFIDQEGVVVKSIDLNRTAYAVGGAKYESCSKTGGGKLFGEVYNGNSVSIELCDIVNKEPSEKMLKSVWETILYINKHCPNIKGIVRHFDVNGKPCPSAMTTDTSWNKFKARLLDTAVKY